MPPSTPDFETRVARTEEEVRAAQHLRYRVFVTELGGDGDLVDHDAELEQDAYDPFFDHILLFDHSRGDTPRETVVGVYRVLRFDQAEKMGRYYSEGEYDLTALKTCGRRLLELGRSCVDTEYRGGTALYHLWNGLADYVLAHDIEILFGVASFHGTDLDALKEPLSYLHHNHLAPESLRVRAITDDARSMDMVPADGINRKGAMTATPALIKAYLRMGGFVGEGAFLDHAFNTTDVCLIMDTEKLSDRQRKIYTKGRG